MVVIGGGQVECPVLLEWLKLESVASRAASKGVISLLRGNSIDRTTVCDNYELLKPLVANLGI